jgi:hypothetical protein
VAPPDERNPSTSSEAVITVDDCVVESSKEISYVAFSDDGEQFAKVEFDDGVETFDLTEVDETDEADTVEVKSGQTVETFTIDSG